MSGTRLTRRPAPRRRYDADTAARVIGASAHSGAQQWPAEYVLNRYSDTEALDAFTAIARAQA